MNELNTRPLVIQELTEFYRGPLREALDKSGTRFSFGRAGSGDDFDGMAFDQKTMTALVEIVGDGTTESGRVIGYGPGREIVFHAVSEYTAQFGAPATFVAELSDQPAPRVIRGVVATIAR